MVKLLAEYNAKRDFAKTPEPKGRAAKGGGFSFCVQKHDASRLHYDFRLELDGVLKSWAVAKGPSLVPGEKRLAVHTEDHPLDYGGFEGTIPKGEYGGGTVLLWDQGHWEPEGDPHEALRKGNLKFRLHGEKLGGAWHLVRMRPRPRERQEGWLLIKSDDAAARAAGEPDILVAQPLSVKTGRSLEEIAADSASAVWRSNRPAAEPAAPAKARKDAAEGVKTGGQKTTAAKTAKAGKGRPEKTAAATSGKKSSEDTAATKSAAKKSATKKSAAKKSAPAAGAGKVVKDSAAKGAAKRAKAAPVKGAKGGKGDTAAKGDKTTKRTRAQPRAARASATRRADEDETPGTTEAPPGGRKAAMPDELAPCLATLVAEVPKGPQWLHEIKWDGYRLVAFVRRGKVRLKTRNGHDWTERFPAIAEALAGLPVEAAVVDGEAVVEDEAGLSSFSALQQALSDGGDAGRAVFYAFDLLYRDGFDLRGLSLDARKAHLAALVPPGSEGALRLSEHIEADGEAMVRNACRLGLEGVISKGRDRPYRSGRTGDWLKIKCTQRQEFVVCGFTPSTALTRAVGSLVLGYHENGRLVHAGRTGTGFTAQTARAVWTRLQALRRDKPPFADPLTALQRRDALWVEPRLVAEVEFRGWTADLHVRHAAFKGLREDKDPAEVVREAAADTAEAAEAPAPPPAGAPARAGRGARAGGPAVVSGVTLTHPDRILWEEPGVTKQGLAEFYEAIAEWILPHVTRRPLALVRCPSGAAQGCFFQKHSWAGLSDLIRRATLRDEDGEEEVLFIDHPSALPALVQAGVLEIHPWGATVEDVDRPDRITMDLDPGEGVGWPEVIAAAQEVRERLAALRLESFVKTTGGKGLHVVVPLAPRAGWEEVKAFTRRLAESMEADSPQRFIAKATKTARRGLIYVDYLRNGRGATAVSAYSTRARPGAPVAVPLAWDELSPALKPNHYTVRNLPARLDSLRADPWDGFFSGAKSLPSDSRRGVTKTTRRS